jgi:hypothetical protein
MVTIKQGQNFASFIEHDHVMYSSEVCMHTRLSLLIYLMKKSRQTCQILKAFLHERQF